MATFRGKALDRWPTRTGRSSYSTLYHWRCVARWRGLTWEYFSRLPPDAQAGYIAEYETAHRLEYLEAEAARKEAERRAKRVGGKSRV